MVTFKNTAIVMTALILWGTEMSWAQTPVVATQAFACHHQINVFSLHYFEYFNRVTLEANRLRKMARQISRQYNAYVSQINGHPEVVGQMVKPLGRGRRQ